MVYINGTSVPRHQLFPQQQRRYELEKRRMNRLNVVLVLGAFVVAMNGTFQGVMAATSTSLHPPYRLGKRRHRHRLFTPTPLTGRTTHVWRTLRGGDDSSDDATSSTAETTTPDNPPHVSHKWIPIEWQRILTSPSQLFGSFLTQQHQASIWSTLPAPVQTALILYAFTLLGSSVGFVVFVYFISTGYALGIGVPVLYLLLTTPRTTTTVSAATTWHTALVLLWSLRMTVFLLWREYYAWPALHQRLQQQDRPSLLIHFSCWTVYSALYWCMVTPVWFRRHYGAACRNGKVGIVLQAVGLLLESVADGQKCHNKKQQQRLLSTTATGLWKYSTHPNYAGEWLFWLGTVLAGLPATTEIWQWTFMLMGLLFVSAVLSKATQTMDDRHEMHFVAAEREEYLQFREKYGVFGPKRWDVFWSEMVHPWLPQRVKEILTATREKDVSESKNTTAVEEELESANNKDEVNDEDVDASDLSDEQPEDGANGDGNTVVAEI